MWLRLLIIFSIIGLAEYYSFIVVRSAVRTFPTAWRTGILSLYFVCTALAWLGFVLFRQINWAGVPHLLRNVYIAFVIGFMVGKVFIMLIMLLDDVRRFFLWVCSLFFTGGTVGTPKAGDVVNSNGGISRSIFMQRLALLTGGFLLGGFILGVRNRYNYHVRNVKIKFPHLPEAFRGMKIVQISDIHSGSFDSHHAVEEGVKKVMEQSADLIVFTGDLVNNKSEEAESFIPIFSKLKAPLGVYSTLGNHDYGDYHPWPSKEAKVANLDRLKQIHAEMGWRLMMNEHVELQRGNDSIALIGIENWGAKAGFPKYGDMKKAYDGLHEKNIPFKILLSHDPSHWDAQVRKEYSDIDLTLSGHTHGMQFGIEIPGFKWSPVQYLYKEWAGLYQEDSQYIYVNRGFGFLGYPGRLGILPEITVIELA